MKKIEMTKYIVNKSKPHYLVSFIIFNVLLSIQFLIYKSIKMLVPILILYLLYLLKNFFETKLIKVYYLNEILNVEYKQFFKIKNLQLSEGEFYNEFKTKKYYNGTNIVNYWHLYINKKRRAVFEIRKEDLEIEELKNLLNF